MSQRAKKTVSILTILLTVGLGAIFLRATIAGDSDSEPEAPALVMETGVEVLLLRMGLDPDAFAAAGLSGASLQDALAAEEQNLEGSLTTLDTHDAACASAQVTMDALKRKVRSGQASAQEIEQLQTAKSTHATATAARTSFFEGLCDDILDNVSGTVATKLRQIRANQRWKNLPVAYRVESRTEAQWVAVREALAAKRTHEARGDAVPQAVTTLLSNLDADADVAAASSAHSANIASVQSTWDSVFGY